MSSAQRIHDLNRLTVCEKAPSEWLAAIDRGLRDHAQEAAGRIDESCHVFLEDSAGSLVAGLKGWTGGGTFYVSWLWVDSGCRGQGLGTQVMQACEQEARRRSCRIIRVDTAAYQAPDFYRKLGYGEETRITGYYGEGYDRIFFRKELRS